MGINIVEKIDDLIHVNHMLVSVSDKSGLEAFIPKLIDMNPRVKIFSTGGTLTRLKEILGKDAGECLIPVSAYTGQPETQGGLVKTLDFKIYLALLTETYNEDHRQDLKRTDSVPIDMVVVNLYPFNETIARKGVTIEEARGNIDIGGPCMIRASAKNYLRVASIVNPSDYTGILSEMAANNGSISLDLRFRLAKKAFEHTALYDRTIADFLAPKSFEEVKTCYRIVS